MKTGIIIAALMTLAMLATGCIATVTTAPPGTTGTTSIQSTSSAGTGAVQVWVTDAPRTDNISEIWVTVSDVGIHEAASGQVSDNASGEADAEIDESTNTGGWISANLTGPARFDLLTLRGENGGGVQQILATANLSAGRYTQIRMTIEEVEVNIDGVVDNATLPSGKLKFVHPFDVQAGSVTKLLFDFNADKFVNVTGSPQKPKIIVKPVVRLIVSKPQAATPRVKMTTSGLPDGKVGDPYDVTLTVIGGRLPYSWTLFSGNLTGGLALSPTGVISGVPLAGTAGDYEFEVKVSDNSTPPKSDTAQFEITIKEATLTITTTDLDVSKTN
jgi:hypothetical protein